MRQFVLACALVLAACGGPVVRLPESGPNPAATEPAVAQTGQHEFPWRTVAEVPPPAGLQPWECGLVAFVPPHRLILSEDMLAFILIDDAGGWVWFGEIRGDAFVVMESMSVEDAPVRHPDPCAWMVGVRT